MTPESYSPPKFQCVNCGKGIPVFHLRKLYCSGYCVEEGKYVRYYRACIKDGRIKDKIIQDTLKIRLASLLSGGYDRLQRKLPKQTREFVLSRDNYTCQSCGRSGKEIDHIRDSSSEPGNLQVLCKDCHMKKTLTDLVRVGNGFDFDLETTIKTVDLDLRVNNPIPLQESDDEQVWATRKVQILRKRKVDFLESILKMTRSNNLVDYRQIADYLNVLGVPMISGKSKWNRKSVGTLLRSADDLFNEK